MGWLGNLLKVAAPVAGFALGGPLGAMAGSAVGGALSGAEKGSKSSKLRDQALQIANQRYAAGSPFRSKLATLAQRRTAQRPDMGAMFADQGNPYARQAPRPNFGQGMPPTSGLAQQAGLPPAIARRPPPRFGGFR